MPHRRFTVHLPPTTAGDALPGLRRSPHAARGAGGAVGTDGDRSATCTGTPVRTPAQARRVVSDVLCAEGAVSPAGRRNALLVASELVTNAVRHAGGVVGFAVGVETAPVGAAAGGTDGRPGGGTCVRIDVEDAVGSRPRTDPTALRDPYRLSGRGWALVQLLAATGDVLPLPGGGKRVSVTVPL